MVSKLKFRGTPTYIITQSKVIKVKLAGHLTIIAGSHVATPLVLVIFIKSKCSYNQNDLDNI